MSVSNPYIGTEPQSRYFSALIDNSFHDGISVIGTKRYENTYETCLIISRALNYDRCVTICCSSDTLCAVIEELASIGWTEF